MSLTASQEEYLDYNDMPNTSRINDEANDRTKYNINSQINGDPLVLVPLSVLRSCLKRNVFSLSSHETDEKSKRQVNPNHHSSMKNTMSSRVIKNSENFQDLFYRKLKIGNLTTPSKESSMPIPRKGKALCKKVRRKGKQKRQSNAQTYQATKSESSTNTRTCVGEIRPIKGVKEEQKCAKNSQNRSHLCKVCNDTASKHVHYGGTSCHSCRAFFRRSIEATTKYAQTGVP